MAVIAAVTSLCAVPVAASAASAPTYSNCAAMNRVYPGGVSLTKNAVNRGGKIKYRPAFNAAVYKANKSKDRDGDGIACER